MGKTKLCFLPFIFWLSMPTILNAQQDSVRRSVKMKRGLYENFSYIHGNFSRLNDVLTQNGFPALENVYGGVAIGISARPCNKDSYFTGKIFVLSTSSSYVAKNDPSWVTILFYGIHDEWHLDLVKNNKWRVGPDFGFGAGFLRLKIFERLNAPGNFAATLSPLVSTYAEKKLHSSSIFMNAGMGIDRKFKIGTTDFYFGVGVGYRLSTPARFSEKYQTNFSPYVRLSGVQYDIRLRFELREITPPKRALFRKFH